MFNETTFNTQFNQFTPDVFRNPLFRELRVFIDTQGECWFIGYEVASRLGYKDTWSALNRHVFDEYKQVVHYTQLTGESPVNPGNPNILLVHELGLYSLVGSSELPDARPFQKWVHRKIKDLRKYGITMSPQFKTVMEIDEEQAYRAAEQRILEQQQRIDTLQQQNQGLQQQNNELLQNNKILNVRNNNLHSQIDMINNRRNMANSYRIEKLMAIRDIVDDLIE